ncbi:MAG: hypothetical protein Q9161_000636 [Pseudevernia consocians]
MGLRLNKTRPERKPEVSKVNVVKRFGAKFRKAFSKKKQSDAQPLKEAFVQEFQPAITTHPSLLPNREEHSLKGTKAGVVQGHIGFEGNSQIPKLNLADNRPDFGLGIDPRGFAVTTSPETSGFLNESVAQVLQQATQQQEKVDSRVSTPLFSTISSGFEVSTPRQPRRARRSSCPPPCTSSPNSNHSSETLFSTPTHSETSSPTFTESCRTVDKHGIWDDHCWLMLADHLKTEEQETQDTTWEVVVEWLKFAHQTEVAELRSQVFIADAIRQARDVDLANEKDDHDADLKTMETLKEERSKARRCLSERTTELRSTKKELRTLKKSIEETREQRAVDETSVEDGDTEEGGVRLTGASSPNMSEVRDLHEDPDTRVQSSGETGGEVDQEGSVARVKDLEMQNETLKENLEYATDEVARLRSEAKPTQDEVKKLRAENHFAQLEVGHCHALNAGYRQEMEDTNPARVAHLDGYLKRKDEAYAELEMRAADSAAQLADEQKNRAIDNVYAEGKINGLNKELAHQFNVVAALTEGRDDLNEQKEAIFLMFEKKIFPSDVDEAFRHDYDIIQKDNAFLAKMVNERRSSLEDAEKPVADLKAEKLILENEARSDQLKQRQMQQSINGLEVEKGELQNKVEILTDLREEDQEEFNGKTKQQAEEIERLLRDGAENGWRRLLQAQAQELVNCRGEVTRLAGLAEQWRMRAVEVQDDFCPMFHFAEVRDWNAEESRWRLHHAERRAAELEKKPAELEKKLAELERKFRDAVKDGKKREG